MHAVKYLYLLNQLTFNLSLNLNQESASSRRQWIIEVEPTTTEVHDEFPALMDYMMVRFRTSVVTLLAYHYVLNIKYSPQTQVICKFFEKFCLELNSSKKLSPSVVGLISAIQKHTTPLTD